MTDRTNEQGDVLHRVPPMYTPEQFDALLAEKPDLRDRIAGFTTVGLEHYKKWSSSVATTLGPYGEEDNAIFCDLDPAVYRKAFQTEPADEPKDLLRDNRAHGKDASITELLMEKTGLDYKAFVEAGLDDAIPALTLLFKPDYTPTIAQWAELREKLASHRVNSQDITDMRIELQHRGGMQYIIGPRDEFLRFLDTNNAFVEAVDDHSCKIGVQVPNNLILAVIAVGEYEQQQLGLA